MVMATFCTDNFTIEEIELLRSILLSKFNIQSTRVANSSGQIQYRIRIRKSSMTNLKGLVGPHMPSSMQCGIVLGSNPASFRIIGSALVLVTCSRVSS
jgi:hypothetical protein